MPYRSSSAVIAKLAADWQKQNFTDCPARWQKAFCHSVSYLVTGKWPQVGRPETKALQLIRSVPALEDHRVGWEFYEACALLTGKVLLSASRRRLAAKRQHSSPLFDKL